MRPSNGSSLLLYMYMHFILNILVHTCRKHSSILMIVQCMTKTEPVQKLGTYIHMNTLVISQEYIPLDLSALSQYLIINHEIVIV